MGSRIWKWDTYDLRKYPNWGIADVLDVGANIGRMSMMCRILFPLARIFAIEPCMEAFDMLKDISGVWGIQCINMALGNGKEMRFYGSGRSGHNRFFTKAEAPNILGYSIKSNQLSNFCELSKLNKKRPYIIKIDCEGSEKFILDDKNAIEYIQDSVSLLIELHFKRCGSMETWQGFFQQFKDTHDLLECHWYRDNTRRHYAYKKIENIPLSKRCHLQLLNKNWVEITNRPWWL